MSSLDERLRRLRGGAAEHPAARDPAAAPLGAAPVAPPLAERLQRLAPLRARPRRPARLTEAELAALLGAEPVAPGVLACCERLPLDQLHRQLGCPWPPLATSTLAALLPELLPEVSAAVQPDVHGETSAAGPGVADPAGWRLLDTETSGLAGGTGTWVFVCGIGSIAAGHLQIHQYLLTRPDAEVALLACIDAALAGASLLISFNGKTFDLPLLATRWRLSRTLPAAGRDRTPAAAVDLGPADAARHCPHAHSGPAAASGLRTLLTADLPHLDLLHPLRRAFARRWPDCRLASAEARLLGLQRGDDLPGAAAPAAWRDWLQLGDPGRLGAVLRHNRLDLVALLALLPALVAVQRDPAAHGADVLAVARQLRRQGHLTQARAVLTAAGPDLEAGAALLLADLHRQQRDWPAALAIWRRLAAAGEVRARECLAKYHEHVSGDLASALAHARALPASAAREQRCRRLGARLGNGERLVL
ncbi:MAG: hypothetical protein EA400_10370 [Chromatiaceae bacterium]|nr:MAG: hypothetical protein EA400_10370 [Chromatiaceae bacterium]